MYQLFFLSLLLFTIPPAAVADAEYFTKGSFTFPTDASGMRTPQPLEPYRLYEIRLSSPYDLSPLVNQRPWSSSGVVIDEAPAVIFSSHTGERDSRGEHTDLLTFRVYGTGAPLAIRTAGNYSAAIKTAQLDIVPYESGAERMSRLLLSAAAEAAAAMPTTEEVLARLPPPRTLALVGVGLIPFLFSLLLAQRRQAERRAAAETRRTEQEPARDCQREPYPISISLTPGVETFTSEPLPDGQPFKITFDGTYECQRWDGVTIARMDACYDAARSANFTYRYYGLDFDSCTVGEEPFEADRSCHRYSFKYAGTGKKLALLLKPPSNSSQEYYTNKKQALTVTIRPLSPQEEELLAAPKRQQEEEKQQVAASEAQKRAAARAAEIAARFQDLEHRYGGEEFRFLEDPAYLADYAKKYMTKLLSQYDKITDDYSKFVRDAAFIIYLKGKALHLLTRATWEWRALAQAMQLDAQQPPAPPPPPPRRKPTIEEIRALKLRRQQAQIGDKIALRKNKIEAILQVRKEMDQYDLDPDERQRVESELIEDILEEEGRPNGTTSKETL